MSELGLHVINKGGEDDEIITNEVVGYTPSKTVGLPPERVDVEHAKCFAKESITYGDGEFKSAIHYLRVGVGGHLLDPWSLLNSSASRQYAKHAGKDESKFVKVGERCFKFYMRYLTTRNNANYLNADRELFTG